MSCLVVQMLPSSQADVSCMVSMQALALLVQGQQKTGLAVGTVVSAALLLLDIKRAYDVGAHALLAWL